MSPLISAIIESSDDAIITKSLNGIILSWNAAAERLFGFSAAEAVGRHISIVFSTDQLDEEEQILTCIRSGKRIKPFDATRVRRDGQPINVSLSISPIHDEDGRVAGTAKIAREITERKQAEAEVLALKRQLERRIAEWQAIFELSPVGISIAEDAECQRIWINPALRQLLRLPEGANASKSATPDQQPPFRILRNGVDVPVHELPMQRCIATGQPVVEEELDVVLADGTTYVLLKSAVPLFDEAGKVRGCFAFNMNVTEHKRAATESRMADRRKNEFLATLAHELRNPLAPVRNALQVLRMKSPDIPEVQWAREVIDRQTFAMTRLIDDIMDVSRINQGKVKLNRERVELANVVKGAVETSRPLIEEMGHELKVTLSPGPVIVDGDLTRLAQIFVNLLDNAAKYTERGGHIGLTAQQQGSDVVVTISDSGIGIPADKLPAIFEMFSQVEEGLSRSQGGLGIGLCLVKRLVEMHGGSIEARSGGPAKGSEFVVRLPIVVDQTYTRKLSDGGDKAKPTSNLRILVVDDNRDGAETLAMLLKMMGNNVHISHDGEEAVAAAREFRPHVVLCDIGLPKLNGYEACRQIKERAWDEKMVLIAVTGWGQDGDRRQAEEAGFDHHIVKPLDPQALMKLLAALNIVNV